MLPILNDLLKFDNYIKAIKQPSKIKNYFNRFNYYPGLKFANNKSKLYKKLEISFLSFLAKKNPNFNKIFFSEKIIENNNFKNFIFFNKKELDQECIDSLVQNGSIIIENFLNNYEQKNLISKVKRIIDEKNSKGKLFDLSHCKKITYDFEIKDFKSLLDISDNVTKEVYGKKIFPTLNLIKTIPKSIPELSYAGDNNLHPDRYLPNLKIFYFPFKVDKNSGPFRYALGSHKIDSNYLNFFIKNDEFIFDDRNKKSEHFLNDVRDFTVEGNSLVIAFTNGFHGRKKFNLMKSRTHIMFTYPSFDFLSLLGFK